MAHDRIDRALANDPPVQIAPAHARLGTERGEMGANLVHFAPAQPIALFGQYDDRTPFWGFIREAGQLGSISQFFVARPTDWEKLGRHTVPQRDGASFV